ncbi:MAG TPA: RNA polymerase sigma factor [Candidatus Nitrosotenuis sp.]|nr:RNA polymerase sigma factor [Candidatus Nitrosotenuis sp.]
MIENVGRFLLTGQELCLPEPEKAPEPQAARSTESARAGAEVSADAALAAGCAARNIPAFEELFRTMGPKMKSIALNMLGDVNQAEDAVQETFLKIFRAAAGFEGKAAFSTWVYRILMNTCLDARRKRRREPEGTELGELAETGVQPASPGGNHPLRMMLERAMAELPPRQREIFLLFEVEGFRHQEIAEILGVSVAVSKNTLFEAKRALRRMLQHRAGEEGKSS